jgi:AAA+ superfamily predicted ATPase
MLRLTPAQQRAAEGLLGAIPTGSAFALSANAGMGSTTVLRHVHATLGGAFVGLRQFLKELMDRQPLALEEALLDLIDQAMRDHELVIVDDLQLIASVTQSCDYQRTGLIDAVLTAVLDDAVSRGRKLLFGLRKDEEPAPIARRACLREINTFTPLDYEGVLRAHLGSEIAGRLDCAQIHRFAPLLTAWQLRNACADLAHEHELGTGRFMDYLSEHNIVSNVEIEEVQAVDWKDLKGMDDVVAALEAKIALPFGNSRLAAELRLKPRRGVLLAGPPGTGKTTIGRALAHRLKGKFFLIDGTVVANTNDFYRDVRRVFAAAVRNAPSVIFIDDTDLIFEGNRDSGFYRYLATMLDGLESASAERVCVMMTAMDAGSLPPALLRSGRVELWLETRLPDVEARAAIVGEKLASLPSPIGSADVSLLASASHGLTGADLKAIVEDSKLSFAHDVASGRTPRPVDDYFLEAIETVRTNRRNYSRRKPAPFSEAARIGFLAGEALSERRGAGA